MKPCLILSKDSDRGRYPAALTSGFHTCRHPRKHVQKKKAIKINKTVAAVIRIPMFWGKLRHSHLGLPTICSG